MQLTETELQALLKNTECSVEEKLSAEKSRVQPKKELLNKTETLFKQQYLQPLIHEKQALAVIDQPGPVILQDRPRITYIPDFLLITSVLELWCYEVKAKRGTWNGEKEDDSLKMRLLKGNFQYIRMFLVFVEGREFWQKEITLTGRTRLTRL